MSSIYAHRDHFRVSYSLKLAKHAKRMFRSAKSKSEAENLQVQLAVLEQSVRVGVARDDDIASWIDRGWISVEIAKVAFKGYEDTISRSQIVSTPFNEEKLLTPYNDYLAVETNGRDRALSSTRSRAAAVVKWLSARQPLDAISISDCEA